MYSFGKLGLGKGRSNGSNLSRTASGVDLGNTLASGASAISTPHHSEGQAALSCLQGRKASALDIEGPLMVVVDFTDLGCIEVP